MSGAATSTPREALADLVAAYARAVDRRDYPRLAALFTEDGTIVVFDGPDTAGIPISKLTGQAEIASSIQQLHRAYLATSHFLGQHTCTAGNVEAVGEAYCQANHLYEAEGTWMNRVMHIRYQDSYVRRGSSWLFAERRLAVDWIELRQVGKVPTHRR
jgi:ketosteroid isomerase-like protein